MVGWAARAREERLRLIATRLQGLSIAVDVQHLYRTSKPCDHGADFKLRDGSHESEAQIVVVYALALANWLRARGARVLVNDPAHLIFIGEYEQRAHAAVAWRADAYLACHVNAGRGSYCRTEYMAGSAGMALAPSIGASLVADFPEILSAQQQALLNQDRGAVCIRDLPAAVAAVIVEPFFGDNFAHQALLPLPRLMEVGESIGAGVADWWERRRLP